MTDSLAQPLPGKVLPTVATGGAYERPVTMTAAECKHERAYLGAMLTPQWQTMTPMRGGPDRSRGGTGCCSSWIRAPVRKS